MIPDLVPDDFIIGKDDVKPGFRRLGSLFTNNGNYGWWSLKWSDIITLFSTDDVMVAHHRYSSDVDWLACVDEARIPKNL